MEVWIIELDDDNFSTVWAENKKEAERQAFEQFDCNWLYVHREGEE